MGLRSSAIKGTIWDTIGTFGSGFINFIVTMVLARILTPTDFGLIELLLVFFIVSEVIVESGFSQAIIRDKEATNKDFTSVFYINVIIAIAIYSILFFVAPLLANFYNSAALIPLSRVVFLVIIFNALSIAQNAFFSKDINFKAISISSISSSVIAAIIAILMAYFRFGVWALAANLVFFAFFKMVFLWMQSEWRPKGPLSKLSLKKYFAFGSNLLIIGLVDRIVTNLESLLIAKVYSKSDLGMLSQAKKIDSYIVQRLAGVVNRVSYPIFSKFSDSSERLKYSTRQLLKITTYVLFPFTLFIIISAKKLIVVLFGMQWINAAPYLQVWALAGLSVAIYSIFRSVIFSLGKSLVCLYVTLIGHILRILIIVALLRVGILQLVIGIMCLTVVICVAYTIIFGKLIEYKMAEVIDDVLPNIVISILSSVCVLAAAYIPIQSYFLGFVIQMFVAVTTYWMLSIGFKNSSYVQLKDSIHTLFHKSE